MTMTLEQIAHHLILREGGNPALVSPTNVKRILRQYLFDFQYITFKNTIIGDTKDEIEETLIDEYFHRRIEFDTAEEFKTQLRVLFRKRAKRWADLYQIEYTVIDYTLNVDYTETELTKDNALRDLIRDIVEEEKTEGQSIGEHNDNGFKDTDNTSRNTGTIADNGTQTTNGGNTVDSKHGQFDTPSDYTSWENATSGAFISNATRDTSTGSNNSTTTSNNTQTLNTTLDSDGTETTINSGGDTRLNEEKRDRTSGTKENQKDDRITDRVRHVKGNMGVQTSADIIKSSRTQMFSTLELIMDDCLILFVSVLF